VVNATPATVNSIILLVGADEVAAGRELVRLGQHQSAGPVAPTEDLLNGAFPQGAKTFTSAVAANSVNGGFNGHAILSQLSENTAYSYRVGGDGAWSET
jgi:hypothetical protein